MEEPFPPPHTDGNRRLSAVSVGSKNQARKNQARRNPQFARRANYRAVLQSRVTRFIKLRLTRWRLIDDRL